MQKIKSKIKILNAGQSPLNKNQERHFSRRCNLIKKLIEETEKSLWQIGDMVLDVRSWYIHLRQQKGITPAKARKEAKKVLAARLGITTQRVAQYADTAEFFTPENRVFKASFFTHEQARKINKTVPLNRRCSAQEISDAMRSNRFSTRDITAWIKDKQSQKIAQNSRRRSIRWIPKMRGLANIPHHCSWEDLVDKIPAGAINGFVWADPPFGVFKQEGTRSIEKFGKKYMTQSDNISEQAALQTTQRLFELLPDKLASGVPLFLMQSGNSVDNPFIIDAAMKNGCHPHTPLTWVKSSDPSKPGAPSCSQQVDAFGSVTQRILVFSLNERLHRVGTEPNGNVFYAQNTSRAGAVRIAKGLAHKEDHHAFENPPELISDIVKTVLPLASKQLVFEPFGCTAPASVAAIRDGWDWIYCESNSENFRLGERRLSVALETKIGAVA